MLTGHFLYQPESGSPQSTFTTITPVAPNAVPQAYTITTITANQLASGTTTVYLDGIAKTGGGTDYSITGNVITFTVVPGNSVDIYYNYSSTRFL